MTYLQRLILLLVLIGLLSGSAAAQTGEFHILATPDVLNSAEGGEILKVYIPSGWQTVHKEWLNDRGVEEVVPADQTIINWQEMLAIQVMDKVTTSPENYLSQLREALQSSCDFSHFRILSGSHSAKYAEAIQISWCGQVVDAEWGEIVLTRTISGENTLYSLNKSWRTIPFRSVEAIGLPDEEIQYWSDLLKRSELCDMRLNAC
ncbi:hypothetical protein [Nitrincola iocasae]|jgi:hypothetical protein|uniref:Uncharacterized protein n=1 Tax=Nitrincola iocasae TaxID=2614693 RepID=A0A5J6LF39_9GAMM|nr:hypothetical protein [Nitrincola iocasae]QEW07167.1 hypothetical protein F5I99_11985 [Nitrincola iocasae]